MGYTLRGDQVEELVEVYKPIAIPVYFLDYGFQLLVPEVLAQRFEDLVELLY